MKNLLIASDRFLPERNGLVRFLEEIVPLIENKYNVSLLVPNRSRKTEFKIGNGNVKTIKIPTFGLKIADYFPSIPRFNLIKKAVKGAEIVWINSSGVIGVLSMHYAKKYRKPTYVYTHCQDWELVHQSIRVPKYIGLLFKRITLFGLKHYFKRFNAIMVPSAAIKDRMSDLGFVTEKIVIPPGIDLGKFRPFTEKEKAAAKQKLNLENKFVLGYAGRIAREKNLKTLYEAFNILKSELKKDIALLLIGDGPKKHKKLLKNDAVITGNVSDVTEYLKAIDIFVLPSLTETSSLATMEAMACGLPVVTSRVGSIPSYIKDLRNGVFFEKNNVNDLVGKLCLMIFNKDLCAELGNNAHLSMKSLDWKTTADLINKEFEKI